MKKRLVIITDCYDIALSEIRASIFSQVQENIDFEIEPVVPIEPLSLIHGSFSLRLLTDIYPEGTIFTIILNPLREITERILIKTKKKDYTIFSTNTGVLGWTIKDLGCDLAYEINNPGFKPFGGKNVHAPAVGKFLAGATFDEIAKPFAKSKIRHLSIKKGTVVHIDNFGLIKIYLDASTFLADKLYKVEVGKYHMEIPFSPRMRSLSDCEWTLFPGSSLGLLELGCTRANTAKNLDVKIGDIIKITSI